MDVFTAATLAALVVKITSAFKYLSAGQYRQTVTQILPWAAGVAVVWVAAQAEVANGLTIWGDLILGRFDGWSIVLAGVALGSGASFSYDVKKALDGTDSATEPPLGGGPPPPP